MALDARTIGSVIAAAMLAYGELHQTQTTDAARQDLGVGCVQFVAGELASRDQQIKDLTERIRVLELKHR